MPSFVFLALFYVAFTIIGWLTVRSYYPELLEGQKKHEECRKCSKGVLVPKFRWWRYLFMLILPPAIVFVIGRPDSYRCNQCNGEIVTKKEGPPLTRVYLTHELPPAYVAFIIVGFIMVVFFLGPILIFLK